MRVHLGLVGTAAATLFLSAGCVSITAAKGPYAAASAHVVLGDTWSDVTALSGRQTPKAKLLTIDGLLLDRLYVVGGLSPGDSLVRAASKEKPTPKFRADMTFNEQVEFIVESLGALGYFRVETRDVRPQLFGSAQGLRFEIDAQTQEGLNIDGSALATVSGGRLYMLLFLAPEEHYFPALKDRVERIIASAKIDPKR